MLERNALQWIGFLIMLVGFIIPISAAYFNTPASNFQFCGIPILCELIGTLFMAAGGRYR